ncbi:hypothetical protein N7489_005164 [Penicillium chrysogenum]|jgi:hypothetical protein|uniref:Uncharacterized protein n=1 Tax=Penicillium chrysogenum TaxID=5076 RepID=A0ABQ8WQU0_PENCH|nr:uncharacterized protein N7489_005164 [Penicillium chrysogenum]KAJ5245068.1 hypothetical protein N7489_005164 [Penicillium chrysogenum]KAJ5274831.1 hypothetical protein N7505_003376 [Penicillium chrysogenum]KAJ5285319.1 hypothetical protein N7524_000625 [Penicillium chrysogenum]KAJ6156554.1 hypothetical protein N7497_005439 [Penicillium chrysogenum]
MSLEDFRECFGKYENAWPDNKKRRREDITLGYARCVWKIEQTIQFAAPVIFPKIKDSLNRRFVLSLH